MEYTALLLITGGIALLCWSFLWYVFKTSQSDHDHVAVGNSFHPAELQYLTQKIGLIIAKLRQMLELDPAVQQKFQEKHNRND